jgi:hypothetical protein
MLKGMGNNCFALGRIRVSCTVAGSRGQRPGSSRARGVGDQVFVGRRMKDKSRARRRLRALRCKVRARSRLRHSAESIGDYSPVTDRVVGIRARTPAACSCSMCGNPRRFGKGTEAKTRQERKAEAGETDE